jgi:hypothetical protein
MTLNLNYNSLTTGIINYLARNSSTVDSGLSNSVSFIGDLRVDEYSLKGNQLPGISVDLVNHSEELTEWNGISYGGTVECTWEIGVHTRLYNSYTALQKDLRTFVQNVEFAFRSDATLSGTFDLAVVTGADFGNVIRGNAGSKQKNGLINLKTTNFIR